MLAESLSLRLSHWMKLCDDGGDVDLINGILGLYSLQHFKIAAHNLKFVFFILASCLVSLNICVVSM